MARAKECKECGYSKSGICKDRIRVCLDCGAVWPTSGTIADRQPDAADNWRLRRVDNVEHVQDDSGIYVYVNWDVETESARLDIMVEANAAPLQSFAGTANNVRKHAVRWLQEYFCPLYAGDGLSAEHVSYIGFELARADAERIDYVQG